MRKTLEAPSLLRFVLIYTFIVIAVVALELLAAMAAPSMIPAWSGDPAIKPLLKDIASYLLAAQVTMIGLLFPIAISLVALLTQREDTSSTISDVQVYYDETLAYQIGASSIGLTIVLTVQLFWPSHFVLHQFGFGTSLQFFKVALTSLHAAWLVLNLAVLWHFLHTSLSFTRPAERANMRRRFVANRSIPADLSKRLTAARYMSAGATLVPAAASEGDGSLKIFFGSSLVDIGDAEITDQAAQGKTPVDVWMRPLGWVLRRWWRRCERASTGEVLNRLQTVARLLRIPAHWMPGGRQPAAVPGLRMGLRQPSPTLVFLPRLERPLEEGGVVCRRQGGVPFNALERWMVRQCFRYGRFSA